MVDVSEKQPTLRRALAEGFVRLQPAHMAALDEHPKGDALAVAQVAGIQAAKRTSELIPLCHQLPLQSVSMWLELEQEGVRIRSECVALANTGVEMEAITAVLVAAATIYDMLKSAGHGMVIEHVRLIEKTGGKSDWKT